MPVAVCTPPDDKNLTSNINRGKETRRSKSKKTFITYMLRVGSKDCLTVKSGTNILNCKTEEEWRRGGDAACSERGLTLRSTKVKMFTEHAFTNVVPTTLSCASYAFTGYVNID